MKLEFFRQILEKNLKYQISLKSVHRETSFSMRTDGQTWKKWSLIAILRNAPEKSSQMEG